MAVTLYDIITHFIISELYLFTHSYMCTHTQACVELSFSCTEHFRPGQGRDAVWRNYNKPSLWGSYCVYREVIVYYICIPPSTPSVLLKRRFWLAQRLMRSERGCGWVTPEEAGLRQAPVHHKRHHRREGQSQFGHRGKFVSGSAWSTPMFWSSLNYVKALKLIKGVMLTQTNISTCDYYWLPRAIIHRGRCGIIAICRTEWATWIANLWG